MQKFSGTVGCSLGEGLDLLSHGEKRDRNPAFRRNLGIMIFGEPTEFSIEAYHEPYGPQWAGCGRMAIDVGGARLGNIRENHCSLFAAVDCLRKLSPTIEELWDKSFTGLSDAEIFAVVDQALYLGDNDTSDLTDYARFDFLTNTGEQFDDSKTFIVCRPDGRVHVLYQLRDDTIGSASCRVTSFRAVTDSFVGWFDQQVREIAPPYFPINPFDLNEKVPDNWNPEPRG